jgi:D-alanyl-D-alanine carboxypeptidase
MMIPTRTRHRSWAAAVAAAALVGIAGCTAPAPRTPTGLVGTVSVQAAVPPALQSELDDIIETGVPGALIRSRNGDVTQTLVSGKANTQSGAVPAAGDKFRIASLTKTFTATVVLQLVAEKKLALDDTVEKHLPGVVPNGSAITIRMLLNHTSGLYDYLNDALADAEGTNRTPPALAPYFDRGDWDHVWQEADLVRFATAQRTAPTPGAFHYSNTGYVVAGMIVRKVAGRSIADEVTTRIIRRLNLSATTFPTTDATMPTPHMRAYLINMPRTSRWRTGFDITTFSPSLYWGAAGMVSNAADVATFYNSLLGGDLLPAEQLRQMQTTVPAGEGYAAGLGIFRFASACGSLWGHDGSAFSYSSMAVRSEDGSRQAVVALNSNWNLPDTTEPAMLEAVRVAVCGEDTGRGTPTPGTPAIDAARRVRIAPN